MDIITVATQKGGTGKTTSALILANAAAEKGKNVLLVDLDAQCNLSFSVGADLRQHGALELLTGMKISKCIQTIDKNLDIICGNWGLQRFYADGAEMKQLCFLLPQLKPEYDLIIIDTPPTAGRIQYNALKAANIILIPLQADVYSLQSLDMIAETGAHAHKGEQIRAAFIFANIDGRKKNITQVMAKKIIEAAKSRNIAYIGKVSRATVVEEAAAMQKNIYEYAPNSKPAREYMEILGRLLPEK